MKKIIVSLMAAVCVLFGAGIPAAGEWVSPDFTEYTAEFTVDAPAKEWKDYYLAKKLTVTEDFALPGNTHLYIRAGGELVIKKGACFTANGSVTIERGGRLFIQNGTFTEMFLFQNFGEIEVGKKGSLILSGCAKYSSNAGSRLTGEGEVLFGALRLSDLTERIEKLDQNFSLDSYCIKAYNCGGSSSFLSPDIFLYYCIGDIETDYYYKARHDDPNPKITRKSYSLARVYNAQRAEKLKRAAEKYAEEKELYRFYDDPAYFEIDIGFMYSYQTRSLEAHAYGFHAGYDPDDEEEEYDCDYMREYVIEFMDYVLEEKVGRI